MRCCCTKSSCTTTLYTEGKGFLKPSKNFAFVTETVGGFHSPEFEHDSGLQLAVKKAMIPTWGKVEGTAKPDKINCKNSYLLPEQLNMSAFGTLSDLRAYSFSMPVFCTFNLHTIMQIACKYK